MKPTPGSTREPIQIVLACDGAYVMPLATTLRSAVESTPSAWPLSFHVMCHGVDDAARRAVLNSLPAGSASIRWVDVDVKMFSNFGTGVNLHISLASYIRFLIPEVFPSSTGKILYLDTDVLVLEDLTSLWNIDLGNNAVGAIADRWHQWIKEGGVADVPVVQSYFNAGVLLINLPRWRQLGISEKALAYMQQFPKTPFMDQDALNVACDGSWLPLAGKWNFQDHLRAKIVKLSADQRPAIVHFISKRKPWLAEHPTPNHGLYDEFRARTRFARSPWQKLTDPLKSVPFHAKKLIKALALKP